jgi:integrase
MSARAKGLAPAVGTSKTTFRAYALEWSASQPWAPGTRDRMETTLHRHLFPVIGDVPIARLRPTQLQAVVSGLSDRLAPSSVGLIAQHLSQVLNAAVLDGLRPDNPAKRVRLPRPDGHPLVVPTAEQVRRLLDVIDPRSRALVAVGAGLGLRQGEALALMQDAVNFLGRTVEVRAQLRKTARGPIALEDTVKTGMARTVPLPEVVADELAAHMAAHDMGSPDGLLFTSATGLRIRHDFWNSSVWRPAATAVGLDAGYHSLRHFCATSLLRQGVSVAAVAKVLGNSPATVLRYYAHYVADDAELVRGILDDVLSSPDHRANEAHPEGG